MREHKDSCEMEKADEEEHLDRQDQRKQHHTLAVEFLSFCIRGTSAVAGELL